MSVFGDRLTNLRKNIWRIPRKQMAEKLKVSYPTYSNWENGRRIPDADIMADLAKSLNTSLDYLQGLTDNPNPQNDKPTSSDLDEMLDDARSYDGKPMDDHDRELIRTFLKGLYANK